MANQNTSSSEEFFSNYWHWMMLVVGGILAAGIACYKYDEPVPVTNVAPFSGPLQIEAPGCEIKGPDGRSIKAQFLRPGEVLIPKGSSFNADCFPVAKAARKVDLKSDTH